MGIESAMTLISRRPQPGRGRIARPAAVAEPGPAFGPLSIAGLEAWYDAQATNCFFVDWAETTPATHGSLVGRWKDQSGKARHLGSESDQETYKGTLVAAAIHGKPAYSTLPNKLLSTQGLNVALGVPSQLEIWVVIKKVNTTFGTHVFGGFRNGGGASVTMTLQTATTSAGWICSAGGNTKKLATSLNTNPHLFRAQVDFTQATAANEIRVWLDGVEGATATGSTNNTDFGTHKIQLGESSSSAEAAYIGEFLAFSPILSDADALLLSTYLRTKWGLA